MSKLSELKISRYIYIPFICGSSFALFNYLLLGSDFEQTIWNFVNFSLFGFAILLYNDYKIRKLSSKNNDEIYSVRQKRSIVLFTNYERAFDLCLESVNVLRKAKLLQQNKLPGIIRAKTGVGWHSFGNDINFELKKITEFTTEIEITCQPLVRTTLVDYGKSFELAEQLRNFFDTKNDEINERSIEAKTQIPAEFVADYKNTKARIN